MNWHKKTLVILFVTTFAFSIQAESSAQPERVAPNISSGFSPHAILATMKKAADWQLAQPAKHPAGDWTYGAFYAGVMALSLIADDLKYHDAMVEMGARQAWKPPSRIYHADDHVVAQTYLDLYLQHRDPAMLGPVKERFDTILAHPKTHDLHFVTDGSAERWSWCDSLFMGPAAWMRLYNATGDKRYLDFMDKEWQATSDFLYDKEEHLYFRDSRYFNQRETNGKKIFWSRGNGWVMAGLARVLQNMPPDYQDRTFFEQQFREMAAKIASLQQAGGLWRSSLLDPASYPNKETSGSGFYTFALTWGINRGILDQAAYRPVVRKAWKALVKCVTPEGMLEHVQPIGADPGKFDPASSDVYGVGAFLLAGSEMYRLALSELPAAAYCAFLPQRMDDFAWENDRIAFRVYGPALERTGEISSGIDVWVKRTRRPIVEQWYYLADYHEDHGEGLDMYKVGSSRGCGGTGIWRNGKLYVANNFLTCHVLECGPKRAVFELSYAPYDAGGITIHEIRRISLETGSNLNRIECLFDWDGGPEQLPVVVGIVKREGGGSVEAGNDGSWMTYWEPEQAPNGTIGCGLVMTSAARPVETKDQAFLQTRVKRGLPLVYYAGAGWTRSGDFADKDSWVKYVTEFSRKVNARRAE
jgi:rhamnogalacturonyl hydrolase YesR